MITLYGYGEKIGVRDPSPFVLKIHTYLRMTGLPYNSIDNPMNLRKAPKAKLPFIIDNPKNTHPKKTNKKGKVVADSSFIVDYLKTTYDADLDSWLLDEQQATSHLIAKSLEENLYFCLVYARWIDDAGWEGIKEPFFGKLPLPLRHLLPRLARTSAIKQAHAQGMGRHTHEEVRTIAKRTIDALAIVLDDTPYFLGHKPCTLDAVAYGFLAQTILCTEKVFWASDALAHDNLVAFCKRTQAQYF